MKALSLLLLALLFFTAASAQDTTKLNSPKPGMHQVWRSILLGPHEVDQFRRRQDSLLRPKLPPEMHHPAIYADGGFGYAFVGVHGLMSNYSVNYEDGYGMFTFKGVNISSWRPDDNPYDHRIILFGGDVKSNSLNQLDFMYGWRFVNRPNQFALNVSAGLAVESRYFYYYEYPSKIQTRYQNAATYPGVPIEVNYQLFARRFGASFNIKLSGDVSRYSFAAIGVALGLGYHYKN
jgi:hypothetical protein